MRTLCMCQRGRYGATVIGPANRKVDGVQISCMNFERVTHTCFPGD